MKKELFLFFPIIFVIKLEWRRFLRCSGVILHMSEQVTILAMSHTPFHARTTRHTTVGNEPSPAWRITATHSITVDNEPRHK